ncbi:MAG: Rieske 2Fe-2S domain-containing protein [Cyanothece sp. SIO2G6]|nr:Rieske 2Fe-2S domain-containing protein [Cyanothece sp. SIO2G6]
MERREFLGWVGTGMVAGSLPVAIAACTPNNDSNSDTDSSSPLPLASSTIDSEGFIALGAVTDLEERGFLYDSQANIIVVRNGATFSALNPTCTHHQCPVEWDLAVAMLSCPCHGSKFATDGTVVTGPATENLASYIQVKAVDNMVWVKPS